MITSARCDNSAGVAATVAPAIALALSGVRFQTATSCPTSISRAAMAAPILPIPATPMRIDDLLEAFRPGADDRRSVRGEEAACAGLERVS
jgi:hypothetical protein